MANVNQPAFRREAQTVSINAGIVSDYVLVNPAGLCAHIRVYNSGTVPVFIEPGPTGVVATVPVAGSAGSAGTPGSMVLAPGAEEVIRVAQNNTFIAAITASSTAFVFFTPGEGL